MEEGFQRWHHMKLSGDETMVEAILCRPTVWHQQQKTCLNSARQAYPPRNGVGMSTGIIRIANTIFARQESNLKPPATKGRSRVPVKILIRILT